MSTMLSYRYLAITTNIFHACRFLTMGWKSEIEQQFEDIARKRDLPLGCACVCFRDVSFRVFPTFPVIHRSHMEVFGSLFPMEFVNQHGDPFLFEVYRR